MGHLIRGQGGLMDHACSHHLVECWLARPRGEGQGGCSPKRVHALVLGGSIVPGQGPIDYGPKTLHGLFWGCVQLEEPVLGLERRLLLAVQYE